MNSIDPVVVHQLGNGLTLLVQEEKSHPVVSVQYWVGTGSIHEGPWEGSGLSHLIEHMVFKGTHSWNAKELACRVQQLGGQWNAYTGNTRTVYYIDGPSSACEEYVKILYELVFEPIFPVDELNREKEVIRREMAMYDDDPDSVAYNQLMTTLYRKHPLRWPILGLKERFNLLSYDDMVAYHRQRYTPDNVVIAVAGNIDADSIAKLVDQLGSGLSSKKQVLSPQTREPKQWGTRTVRKEFSVPCSKLSLAWRIPPTDHPDSPALALLCRILGSGRSAWLYEKFHDRLGMVHDISTFMQQLETSEGAFVIDVDVDTARRDEVAELIRQEIVEWYKADYDCSMKRVLKQMRAGYLLNQSTVSGIAESMASQWLKAGNLQSRIEWFQALARVTSADIRRAVSTWLTLESMTESSLDPVGSLHQVQEVSRERWNSGLTTYALANGLKVVVQKDGRLPLVNACFVVKAGCLSESRETAGICSLMAECLLKGTSRRSAAQIAHELEDLGGSIQSASGNNTVSVSANAMAEDVEVLFDVLSDVVLHPVFPEEAFEKERETMIAEAEEEMQDPLAMAFRQLRAFAYNESGYGLAGSGSPESLARLSLNDVREQFRRVFGGEAVLSVSGDVEPEQIVSLAERYFGERPVASEWTFPGNPAQRAGLVSLEMDKEQAVVALAVPGVSVCSPEEAETLLFQAWCADMAGPVFSRVREELGLAYYASSTLLMGLDSGNLIFYVGTAKEQVEAVKSCLEALIAELCTQGMTQEELKRIQTTALAARLLARQSSVIACQSLALNTLFGLSPDHPDEIDQMIANMDVDKINRYIREKLSPSQPRTWSIVR